MPYQPAVASDTENDSYAVALPATPEHVSTSRHKFAQWLSGTVLTPARTSDILLAVGEAVTNAVEHGSQLDPAQLVSIRASICDEILIVTVSDGGCWVDPSKPSATPSRDRGRGLFLIGELADEVDINRSAQGTQITMQFDVSQEIAPEATGIF
jgi:anti-sigma regulatory factor (Ser/Thr protein kinase)